MLGSSNSTSHRRVRNSCLKCRHRKIRCTRERPQCYNCLRLNHVCQYETPPPLPAQPHLHLAQAQQRLPPITAPTTAEQQHIRQRLGELEHAVAQLMSVVPIDSGTARTTTSDDNSDIICSISCVSAQLGNLVTEVDGEPRYRSASHWGQMIKDGFVPGEGENTAASLPLLLFSPNDASFDLEAYLPSKQEAYWLYSTFYCKVDPIVRIIHKPSFEEYMERYFGPVGEEGSIPDSQPQEGSSWVKAGVEALLFAVFYSAVFSLDEEELWQYTQRCEAEQDGTPFTANEQSFESNLPMIRRNHLACLESYRYACCQCLLRSQIFDKQSLPSVTALFLLSFMAFHETGAPSLYTVSGLLIRISRSFGLHIDPKILASRNQDAGNNRQQIDGVPSGLSPALVEIRRRLWHQIVHLDLMASEARGIDPDNSYVSDLWPDGLGCSLPGNYDDSEIAAATYEHPLPVVPQNRGRHTDMSLQLVRFNASACLRKLVSLNRLNVRGGCFEPNCEIEASIEEMVEQNQTQYLQYCSETEQGPYLTLMLGKMCACRARLHHYLFCKRPVSRSENGGQWSPLRCRALENATELQNLFNMAIASPLLAPFVWHIGRHKQLHATLHILNELSSTSPDKLTDQVRQICQAAWESVERTPVVSAAQQKDRQQQASGAVLRVLEKLREAARRYWSPDSSNETTNREYGADNNNADNNNNNSNNNNTREMGQTIFDPYSFSTSLDASNVSVPDAIWNMLTWPNDFGMANPLFNVYNQ